MFKRKVSRRGVIYIYIYVFQHFTFEIVVTKTIKMTQRGFPDKVRCIQNQCVPGVNIAETFLSDIRYIYIYIYMHGSSECLLEFTWANKIWRVVALSVYNRYREKKRSKSFSCEQMIYLSWSSLAVEKNKTFSLSKDYDRYCKIFCMVVPYVDKSGKGRWRSKMTSE